MSRQKHDNEDGGRILDWFSSHSPFPSIRDLVSLSTGVVGNQSMRISCSMLRTGYDILVRSYNVCIKFTRNDRESKYRKKIKIIDKKFFKAKFERLK